MAKRKFQPPEESWQNMNHAMTSMAEIIRTEVPRISDYMKTNNHHMENNNKAIEALNGHLKQVNKNATRVTVTLVSAVVTLTGLIVYIVQKVI